MERQFLLSGYYHPYSLTILCWVHSFKQQIFINYHEQALGSVRQEILSLRNSHSDVGKQTINNKHESKLCILNKWCISVVAYKIEMKTVCHFQAEAIQRPLELFYNMFEITFLFSLVQVGVWEEKNHWHTSLHSAEVGKTWKAIPTGSRMDSIKHRLWN